MDIMQEIKDFLTSDTNIDGDAILFMFEGNQAYGHFRRLTEEEKLKFLTENYWELRLLTKNEGKEEVLKNMVSYMNQESINKFFESNVNSFEFVDFNKLTLDNKKKFLDYWLSKKDFKYLVDPKYFDLKDFSESDFEKYTSRDDISTYFIITLIKNMPKEQAMNFFLKKIDVLASNTVLSGVKGVFSDQDLFGIIDNSLNDTIDESIFFTKFIQLAQIIQDKDKLGEYVFGKLDKLFELDKSHDFQRNFIELCGNNRLEQVIDKYNDKISSYSLVDYIAQLPTDRQPFLFEKYKEHIISSPMALYNYLDLLEDEDYVKNECIKYRNILKQPLLLKVIKKFGSADNIQYVIDNCSDMLSKEEIFKFIFSMADSSLHSRKATELLKYFTNGITDIYSKHKNNNLKLYDDCFKKLLGLDRTIAKELLIFQAKNPEMFDELEKANKSISIFTDLKESNSSEIRHIAPQISRLIFETPYEDWDDFSKRIEDIFLQNNIPYVGKIFKVFEIMHPEVIIEGKTIASPNLNSKNNVNSKKVMIFSDLLKCSLGSNNRSILEYIKNIREGDKILSHLIKGDRSIEDLDDREREIYSVFVKHMNTLYNNTLEGRKNPRKLKNNLIKDSYELLSLFLKNESEDFNIGDLPDRIVKMFSHFAGIDTLDDLYNYNYKKIKNAEQRNMDRAYKNSFSLKKGDYIKGLANEDASEPDYFYSFLIDILQNGSVCKEFLGSSARSDTTPLDTDLSRIETDISDFSQPFKDRHYAAARYGPLWLVVNDDDKLNYSEKTGEYKPDKLEIFGTHKDGAGHYGIRTGFASSDIDYLVVDEEKIKLYRIQYAIAMNGFYIPVLNTEGKLVFTPEQYFEISKKMAGLAHYNTTGRYTFAPELDTFDVKNEKYNINIDEDREPINRKRNLVVNALSSVGLNISTKRHEYIDNGILELLDTGSTGRGTNCKEDYDFDFILRVDRDDFKFGLDELSKKIKEAFPGIEFENNRIIRDQIVKIGNEEVKIDITIIPKDDKIEYTTDECVIDRLNSIKKLDRNMHKKILENIVLAKEVLKEGKAYKSKNAKKEKAEGGMGGVGIENWILQNGGSFERAARTFVKTADEVNNNFEQFKEKYIVYDFGENHLYGKQKDNYKHDEFISNNMNQEGFNKTVTALKKYLLELDQRKKEGISL